MAFGEVGTALSKIKSPAVNLEDTFAFSGTVTGFDKTPLTLLSTFTSDGSDANATFDSSIITDAYDEYLFIFNSIHPETNARYLRFEPSIDNGSNYNLTNTSTMIFAYHREDNGGSVALEYGSGQDTHNGANVFISGDTGNEADECVSGIFKLYNPSSTTFVKHFVGQMNSSDGGSGTATYDFAAYSAGYVNTTSAVNNIKFTFSTGEIQGGTISVFGVA
jgi:hypothetical protein